ncbi:hypothetical protein V7111_10440 [Neobacillus niacini]|uniref:hypothetical protein n=1 Tax=Neobacillus niacini TaxID=86668 RepID=UPI002FFD679A
MQTSSKSPCEFFKEIEDELNRKLYSYTNSSPFIAMAGKAIDQHLEMVRVIRMITVQWLEINGYPSRDDVADIARRIIRLEERLDSLDEGLYLTLVEINVYRNQMDNLKNELAT